ncbi:MAG: hypothetical protein ABI867_13885 [Kofleriaceae bacterium]
MARSTTALIDAIVLAFSKSRLKDVVGTDALKMVLAGTVKEMLAKENHLLLQPVYELLESQPGFVHEDAVPPLCRIKLWESKLKLIVELPKECGLMPTEERERNAQLCYVDEAQVDKILTPPQRTTNPPPLGATRILEGGSAETREAMREQNTSRRKAIAAGVFAAFAIVAMVVSYKLTFGADSGNTRLDARDLTAEIPLTQVRQSGKLVGATLSDPNWLTKPEVDRRRQLEAAVIKASTLGAQNLMVFDTKGKLVASATMRQGKLSVTFAR